jgi:CubicO group peptidase (beta-lactamase class C family)
MVSASAPVSATVPVAFRATEPHRDHLVAVEAGVEHPLGPRPEQKVEASKKLCSSARTYVSARRVRELLKPQASTSRRRPRRPACSDATTPSVSVRLATVDDGDLATLLGQHASRHSVPGAAIGILRGGAAATAFHGLADARTGEKVTPHTRFSVGSLTKPMVATVITRLALAGRLSFDDSVASHVPELRRNPWAQRASVRDLLANRSGLPLRADLEFGFDDHSAEDDDALSRLCSQVPSEAVSAVWSYTNVGWCLLGRIIEVTTDGPWEDAMRRYLFDGLGMTDTAFDTRSAPVQRASGHTVTGGDAVPVAPLVARAYGPAGTNVVSTASDLLEFARSYLDDPSLATLLTTQAEVSIHGWLDAWGLGWARFDWDGHVVWGWDGLIDGERAILRLLPDQRAAIVLMANGSTGRAMSRSLFADMIPPVFGFRFPNLHLDPVPGAAGNLARFAGVYAWPDRQLEVTPTPTGLVISSERGETAALPLDDRSFLIDPTDPDNPCVTFGAFDTGGRPMVLYDMLWGLPRRIT